MSRSERARRGSSAFGARACERGALIALLSPRRPLRSLLSFDSTGKVRPEILQIPLDLTTGSALGPPTKIWSGEGGHAPEAPHAYWKDGWWWLLLAEGECFLSDRTGEERRLADSLLR